MRLSARHISIAGIQTGACVSVDHCSKGLHQMMRFDGEQLRLDGIMHRPALSEAVP